MFSATTIVLSRERIKTGHEDPIMALLLLLLTNLESLTIADMNSVGKRPNSMRGNFHFLQAIKYISKKADTEALRRLIEVKLYHDNTDFRCPGYKCPNLPIVRTIATLPSVKNLHVQSINGGDKKPRLQARSSNVETLCLHYPEGSLNAPGIFELIEGFKGLKTFIYKAFPAPKGFCIRKALVAHTKHSLKTLILRSDDPDHEVYFDIRQGRHYFIGSFRSLEVLKKMEIDHAYLADVSGPRRTRLADALPSSFEELHLHDLCYVTPPRLNPLWAGQELLEDKDTCLPTLKITAFCDDYEIWRQCPRHGHKELVPDYDRTTPGIADLQAACNAKGFRLEIPERRPIEDI